MATYQLRDCDDTILAEAELASDTKAMAWLVSAATRNRKELAGRRWEGFRLVGDSWTHRFSGAHRETPIDPVVSSRTISPGGPKTRDLHLQPAK
nr:hypothetical protein [Rhodococcus sp. (in: high G+C Gram-positive bacteria)]